MNFRNVFIALACMALFAGLAGAQGQILNNIPCTVSASSVALSSENVTGRVGDILITCTQSSVAASPGAVTRANLTVDFGAQLTSKVENTTADAKYGKASEILLLINDPGAGNGPVDKYGQNAAIDVCSVKDAQADSDLIIAGGIGGAGDLSLAAACKAYLQQVKNMGGNQNYWELVNAAPANATPCTPGVDCAGPQAKNAYQGGIGGTGVSWTGNQVKFFNVPVYPTLNANQQNFFRIVNARVNPGTLATISASLSVSTLTVANGNYVAGSAYAYQLTGSPQVATSASGLTTSLSAIGGVSLCSPTNLIPGANEAKANVALVSFKENGPGVFKTRSLPLSTGQPAGEAMGVQVGQTMPNGSYPVSNAAVPPVVKITLNQGQSETGFYSSFTGSKGVAFVAGQADSGTRLKAYFTNLDPNIDYYVSVTPVIDYVTPVTVTATNPVTGLAFAPGDATQVAWAVLQDKGVSAKWDEVAGYLAAAADATKANNTVSVAKLFKDKNATSGIYSAEAVWEVTNVVPGTPQTLTFAVYGVFKTSSTATTPAAGNNATVQLGFAPTNGSGTGQTTTNIPRFNAPGAAQKFDNVIPCQTSLLFPFVTGTQGYNTGIAISNTSADPYGTPTSQGTCALSFYSAATPGTYTTGTVTPGTSYTGLLSGTSIFDNSVQGGTALDGFSGVGYMIATCNFQFAHGFAFVAYGSPSTAGYAAMGYTAPVISGNLRGQAITGEGLGN